MKAPTQEAMKAAFAVKHGSINGDRKDYEFNLDVAAALIDRETNLPALLESHASLVEALIDRAHCKNPGAGECGCTIDRLLAKAKEIQ